MKIAMFSAVPPVPAHEGNRSRILALSRAVREQGHDLSFVWLRAGEDSSDDRAAMIAEFGEDRLHEVWPEGEVAGLLFLLRWLPRRLARKACRMLGMPKGTYARLDERARYGWRRRIQAVMEAVQPDVVLIEYVHYSFVALEPRPDRTSYIIDTHDSYSEQETALRSGKARAREWMFLRPGDEVAGFRRADVILAIQQQEADLFRRQLGSHPRNPQVAVVSHFVDLSAPPVGEHEGRRALFLGSRNASNVRSCRMLIDQVLPLVLRTMPDFRLVLAGKVCEAVEDHPAVLKLGRVEEVREAFEMAPLLINAMVMGTGINIKLLDAMAAGVPVVSTETGARGVPERFRSGIKVCPDGDPEGLAQMLLGLLSDGVQRRRLGHSCRADAERWNEEQHAQLRAVLAALPAGGGR
ncbi:glycosyltransferase family 4 protein [Ancylobacter sp.]|uniref:glycosyltransferase family 4 protein n=1 Tax=Ancylobacter sp. TaxID=1872567 RepID=UPI003BA9045A